MHDPKRIETITTESPAASSSTSRQLRAGRLKIFYELAKKRRVAVMASRFIIGAAQYSCTLYRELLSPGIDDFPRAAGMLVGLLAPEHVATDERQSDAK
jgi:hypothetical protein